MATDADFTRALNFTLQWEGGYVNDPADPGGETKYGISKRSYPWLDIAGLTREQAAGIYYHDYWVPSGAARLAMPLAQVVFDAAVQHGVARAQQWLTQSQGDPAAYLALREAFYRQLAATKPSLAKFLGGWLNRLGSLRAATAIGLGLAGLVAAGLAFWLFRKVF